jgi:hypothetical protein
VKLNSAVVGCLGGACPGDWEQDNSLQCDPQGLCSFTLDTSKTQGLYELQIRAIKDLTGIAGPWSTWRWTVMECSYSTEKPEYAIITSRGSISCMPCPAGGNCTRGTTMDNMRAVEGWWLFPFTEVDAEQRRVRKVKFYECPIIGR